MYIAWEGERMRKVLSIARYDYKMQIRQAAAWAVLLAVLLLSMADNFPSAANLRRLEFLFRPEYFLQRVIGFGGLIMAFALMFLVAGRFHADEKTGVKQLMMAAAVRKWHYIAGKGFAAFGFVFTMLDIFLLACVMIYSIALPGGVPVLETAACFCKAVVISVLPVSIFAGFCAVALPALTDIRLFYLLAVLFFAGNAVTVDSAEAAPFYLLTSGGLTRLIWVHPKWPYTDYASLWANLFFLLAGGLCPWFLLLLKKGFWREK